MSHRNPGIVLERNVEKLSVESIVAKICEIHRALHDVPKGMKCFEKETWLKHCGSQQNFYDFATITRRFRVEVRLVDKSETFRTATYSRSITLQEYYSRLINGAEPLAYFVRHLSYLR